MLSLCPWCTVLVYCICPLQVGASTVHLQPSLHLQWTYGNLKVRDQAGSHRVLNVPPVQLVAITNPFNDYWTGPEYASLVFYACCHVCETLLFGWNRIEIRSVRTRDCPHPLRLPWWGVSARWEEAQFILASLSKMRPTFQTLPSPVTNGYKTSSCKERQPLIAAMELPPTVSLQPSAIQLAVLLLCTIVTVDAVRRFVHNRIERNGHPLPPGPFPLPFCWAAPFLLTCSNPGWPTWHGAQNMVSGEHSLDPSLWVLSGDVMYIRLLDSDAIVLNSRSDAMELLEKRSQIYSDRPFLATLEPWVL